MSFFLCVWPQLQVTAYYEDLDVAETIYHIQLYPAGPEIQQPLPEWRDQRGLE